MHPLAGKVGDIIRAQNFFPGNGNIIVAVSGGIDSIALLHLLATPELGPRVQSKLMTSWASMQAFNVYQFTSRHELARDRLAGWLGDGRLKYREDVVDGIENTPSAFIGLLQGENFGKRIIKVAETTTVLAHA